MYSYDTYLSPFTFRYGSEKMRRIWSEEYKRLLLRRVWVALATSENKAGLVSDAELSDIKAHQNDIDIKRALEIESDIHHDLMAEIKTYAEQCKIGGGKIHLGATSTDALDNAEAVRLQEAKVLILTTLKNCIKDLDILIDEYGDIPCMAYTHLQSAEETKLSHRFSLWKESLIEAYRIMQNLKIRGKGFKGAVGNYSSYDALYKDKKVNGKPYTAIDAEKDALSLLGIEAFDITTQVYPRFQDMEIMSAISLTAAVSSKIAFDIRLLQSSPFDELAEGFSKNQVGSSAMPFKKNPINAEKINSLARFVHSLEESSFENTVGSALERSLDDSANRRLFLPEGFLATEEILLTLHKVLTSIKINKNNIIFNKNKFGVFSRTEGLLMAAVKKGGNRQELHERIRELALKAKDEMNKTGVNPLKSLILNDEIFSHLFTQDEITEIFEKEPELPSLEKRVKSIRKKAVK